MTLRQAVRYPSLFGWACIAAILIGGILGYILR